MKNKKGFTLIELLVVIALVISITIIAIISINSISKKNKEEAYELVKKQIENAAEEYFNTNEYLFEGMTDKAEGYISVGRLVEEGLLNTVTDPRKGEKIAECSLVKVTKEDGKFNINFDDIIDNDKCENDKYIVTVNPEPEKYEDPIIEFSVNAATPNSSWYRNINNVTVEIKVDKKTTIDYLSRGTEELDNSDYGIPTKDDKYNKYILDETNIYKNDGQYSISYDVYDKAGGYVSETLNLNVDGTSPTCKIKDFSGNIIENGENKTYTSNSSIYFNVYGEDNENGSGIAKKYFINNSKDNIELNPSSNSQKITAITEDRAGNTNTCEATITINPKALTCDDVKITYNPSSPDGNNGWYKHEKVWLTITPSSNVTEWYWLTNNSDGSFRLWPVNGNDARSGEMNVSLSKASFERQGIVMIYDSNGNGINCPTSRLKIDGTINKPTINLSSTKQTSDNVTFTLTGSDAHSGIDRLEYSYDTKSWSTYSKEVTLLNYTGTRTVYARAIDNAGNISEIAQATGMCNKDGVSVAQSAKGCNFSLSLTLPNNPSGVTSGKYEYAVWGKVATTDTTNKQSGLVSSKCGNVPKSGATIHTVDKSVTKTISMLKNTQYMYYCFAVRPYRKTEIDSINRWTVQYKHAKLEDGVCN